MESPTCDSASVVAIPTSPGKENALLVLRALKPVIKNATKMIYIDNDNLASDSDNGAANEVRTSQRVVASWKKGSSIKMSSSIDLQNRGTDHGYGGTAKNRMDRERSASHLSQ